MKINEKNSEQEKKQGDSPEPNIGPTLESSPGLKQDAKNVSPIKLNIPVLPSPKPEEHPEANTEKDRIMKSYKPTSRFDKKKTPIRRNIIKIFTDFLEKAGVEENPRGLNNKIIIVTTILISIISLFILYLGIANQKEFSGILVFLIMTWTLGFFEIYMLSILILSIYFDVRLYKRMKQIEDMLPDFLQLSSANISAGMTIDHALWFAVRPRFGILAKEMEEVAKATIAGEDLQKALTKLANKYPSNLLRQSISLLKAGIDAGGEMSELLNKIASNIQETKLMRKEIAASVMTYVIFIGAATIIAAPILFGLSTELLTVIGKITSGIQLDKSSGMSTFFSFDFSGDSISVGNFQIFAILVLLISSFFSAAIISTVRKGNVKDGLKSIPVFMIVAVLLYLAAAALFQAMMSGIV